MRARAILTGAIVAQGCLFASAVVVSQSREELEPSEVTREAPAAIAALAPPTEAPAGFDLITNGAVDPARFAEALEEFIGPEGPSDGLGPVFNAAGCGECHATPIIGGSSQVVERRAGSWDGQNFVEHPGGSLIQDRSLFPGLQERVLPGNNVIAFRASLSILGLGFVEAIDSNTIAAIAQSQPSSVRGQLIQVPVLEAGGALRVGRFGWKNQQASLLSFSADAYSNEMGISTPMLPLEQLSNGQALPAGTDPFPGEPGVTDDANNDDLDLFADFMRSTKVPPRDTAIAATPDSRRGESLFASVGCATCHTPTIVTAPAGTADQRRRLQGPARARQQADSPVLGLPAARHRHRRRHRPERRPADAQQAAHRPVVGPSRPGPVHARRREPELRRRDRAARRTGGGGARGLQRPELLGSQPRAAVPVVVVGNGRRARAARARCREDQRKRSRRRTRAAGSSG